MEENYQQQPNGKNYINKVQEAVKVVNPDAYMAENVNMYAKTGFISDETIKKAEAYPNEKETLLAYNERKQKIIDDMKN